MTHDDAVLLQSEGAAGGAAATNAEAADPRVLARAAEASQAEVFNKRGNLVHRERQIDAIRRISQELFSHLKVDDLVREILRVAIDVLRADVGSLQLYDPVTDRLVFRHVFDPRAEVLTGHSIPASQGIAGRVFRSGSADLTHRADQTTDWNASIDSLTGYHTDSMLTVPLKRFGGEPIGVIQILNSRTSFDHCDLEVLEVLCAYAATSLETARLTEEARKAELVTLIGDISHDIKNMLTPIKSGAWTLETILNNCFSRIEGACVGLDATQDTEIEIRKAMHDARLEWSWILDGSVSAAERVEARTREIADAVKGETAAPQFSEVRLNEVAGQVCEALKIVARSAEVSLRLDLDSALPIAELDSRKMYNAVYNLSNNAIAATPAGGSVTLRTCGPTETDANHLLLTVQDTGGGIPPQVREKLFTDQAVSTKRGGTGLGTRIVAGIVRRHHGTICVDSEEGKGTAITLSLPLRQPPCNDVEGV